MSINLQALEQAFAAVESIGKGELTFDVGGTPVTLRIVLATEEAAVQEWAGSELPGDDDDDEQTQVAVFNFLNRFKLGTLSYAIIQMGDTDLRDADFIETGETLPNGKPVKVPRHEAVRSLVEKWSSTVRDGMFQKYGELINDVGEKSENAIKFKPSDTESEVERLQARISELKAQMEAEKNSTSFADQVQQIVTEDQTQIVTEDQTQKDAADEPVTPAQAAPEPAQAQPAPQAPPAPRRSPVPAQAAPPAPAPLQAAQPPSEQARSQPQGYHHPNESLVPSEDLAAAVASEDARMFREYQAGMSGAPQPNGSVLDAHRQHTRRGGRVPPHMDAQKTAEAVNRPAKPASVGDVPVYRMDDPVEVLATTPSPTGKPELNPTPAGRLNPRHNSKK